MVHNNLIVTSLKYYVIDNAFFNLLTYLRNQVSGPQHILHSIFAPLLPNGMCIM